MGRGKITEAKMAKVYSNPEGVNKARKKEYTMQKKEAYAQVETWEYSKKSKTIKLDEKRSKEEVEEDKKVRNWMILRQSQKRRNNKR